jgi:2,5-dihydroxypyridine 5,6-dioxygenase
MMMFQPIEPAWIDAFVKVLDRCAISSAESVVVLCEQQSRPVLVQLTELALHQLNRNFFRLVVPTHPSVSGPLVRSSGASLALTGQAGAVDALCAADVVVDLTVEGLMHAAETAKILQSGTRIMNVSNEHPDILCRLLPEESMMSTVRASVKALKQSQTMTVESDAGTQLEVNMTGARTVGVWGWTDRPGTLAHWPGGLVVSFPDANTVNGQLVLAAGDLNLTFKRYIESPVTLTLENDYVVALSGHGADCALMKDYLASFNDKAAYATSHVGWGLNPAARYEAMTMYDKGETNGTELRAVAGNFLYSTGANEFAGRFTKGHFDLPVMGCTIALDGQVVVNKGVPVA